MGEALEGGSDDFGRFGRFDVTLLCMVLLRWLFRLCLGRQDEEIIIIVVLRVSSCVCSWVAHAAGLFFGAEFLFAWMML